MPPDEFLPNVGQLQAAWLTDLEFHINPRFDFERHEGVYSLDVDTGEVEVLQGGETTISVKVSVAWEPVRSDTEPDPSDAIGPDVDPADFEHPFDLAIGAAGVFTWNSEKSEDWRIGWTGFNGLYLLWPYVRAQVATVTALSNIPPFTLPTFAVPNLRIRSSETGEFEAIAGPPPAETLDDAST